MNQSPTLIQRVRATMKSEETEGKFELYVTRLPGYLWARFFYHLNVHPITVTLLSLVIGIAAGYFLGATEWRMNLIGIGLLVWANWYDCADGQLARMTKKQTMIGRILDGFAGDAWFFSIYFFICWNLTPTWGVWIWLLAAWSGFRCHARQCSLADYYRNIHLYFLSRGSRGELDHTTQLRAEMQSLRWASRDWFHKLYLYFYTSYTAGQEQMTPAFQALRRRLSGRLAEAPQGAVDRFLAASRPLMKYCNILTFDTRVGVLFVAVLAGVPWVFFVFECVVLEALRHWVRSRHEQACRTLLSELNDNE